MMQPTGILRRTAGGVDLELTRTFRASREDVWASLTESDRTAGWYGPWERLSKNMVRVQMVFEEGKPWSELKIDACEEPTHLAVSTSKADGGWKLEVTLTESDGTTTLSFVHHLTGTTSIGDIGPGWEYYLDMLVASREHRPLPSFDRYYPAQENYYCSLVPE